MRVAVIGAGYVGLVTAVVLADMGNDVICVDNDPEKVNKLRNGISPIFEPGVEELLKRGLDEGFLSISDSVEDATRKSDIVFIAVGTPPGADGYPDLSAVRAVAAQIGRSIDKKTVVVNKSTVPVGSGSLVEDVILEQGANRELFDVVSNPEFLREGSAVNDTRFPERIVIGAKNKDAAVRLVELYAPFEKPFIVTDLVSAEMIKYASNSFLAMKISYINAISRMCEACGGNVDDVARGMGSDARIGGQFLNAGLGWGGSCFPKDVLGLYKIAQHYGYDFHLLKSVMDINDDQTMHALARLEERLGTFSGKTLGLMGLSFKPNTDDIRDAKSLVIIDEVQKRGGRVQAYDPIASPLVKRIYPDVQYVKSVFEVSKGADALILVTEWNEFRQIDLERLAAPMRNRLLFDGRRIYKKAAVEKAGFEYMCVGS